MCGIAGIIDFDNPEPDEALLRRMLGLIRHRGPDAFGICLSKHAGLAHARLSIIDLSGGDQPIHNEDQSIWVVYNGEVFNYPELRENLEKRGHKFYTKTDTEILVHLYEDLGPDFLGELNGQFALAIWDKKNEKLMLGRDRLGIRPLFYCVKDGRFVFGSEVKAIFADPKISRALDLRTLSDIFTCWAPLGSETPFKDVDQLSPGHYAIFSRKGLSSHRYWQLTFPRDSKCRPSLESLNPGPLEPSDSIPRPLESYISELQDLLYDATRIRLRADVPVGAYLSGGLDSTYITSVVKQYFDNQLCTFSVSFTDNRFDEASFQAKAVQALQTDHKRIQCTEKDIGEGLPQVIWHTEVPVLRTAPVPMFQLSRLVRENDYKVVLTGEGSDEIFAGYDIFKEDRIRRFWARQPNSKMRPRLLQRLYPDIFSQENSRGGAFLMGFFRKGLNQVEFSAYSHMVRWENTAHIKSFFSNDIQEKIRKENDFIDRFISLLPPDFAKWDSLSRAQYTEISIFLSNYLLSSQGDRVAMGHSVEGRYPFLDYRVVEFACSLPARYRLNGLKDKFLLRQVAEDLIPSELARRQKQPYRAPISRCFLGDHSPGYVADLLCESALRKSGYFHPGNVAKLLDKCHKQEGKLLSERENMALVGILSTQLLHEMFIEKFPGYPVVEPEDVKIFRG